MDDDVTREPLVSIIIDNYNYGEFVQDAIESALNQTYQNVEVIVVDDGSTDNSREIISKYLKAGRIKAIFKENGGQASAMNTGFQICSGDLVMFLDSDDVLKPNAIETAVKVWRPGVSKVQWLLDGIDANGNSIGMVFPFMEFPRSSNSEKRVLKRWFRFSSSPQSGNLYSRIFLEKTLPLPEEDWRVCADYPLFPAAIFCGEVVSLNEVLSLYRLHGRNAVGINPLKISVVLERNKMVRNYLHERFGKLVDGLTWHGLDEERLILINGVLSNENKLSYASRVKIGVCGALDSLVYPFFTRFSKRILSFIWFLLVGVLPSSLAEFLALKGIPDGFIVG